MREIASKGQLRAAYLRWALVTVPLILLLGFASARLVPTGDANPWFAALAKPEIMPPGWAFPAAWTALYILLGLALAMVMHARRAPLRGVGIALFWAQMVANLVWTPLFFGAHKVLLSLVVIGVLFVLALATTVVFARIRRSAAVLMVPYLAWVAFAFVLLWQLHALNPQAESLVPSASSTQIQL